MEELYILICVSTQFLSSNNIFWNVDGILLPILNIEFQSSLVTPGLCISLTVILELNFPTGTCTGNSRM